MITLEELLFCSALPLLCRSMHCYHQQGGGQKHRFGSLMELLWHAEARCRQSASPALLPCPAASLWFLGLAELLLVTGAAWDGGSCFTPAQLTTAARHVSSDSHQGEEEDGTQDSRSSVGLITNVLPGPA